MTKTKVAKTSISFVATGDEQKIWLQRLLGDPLIYCLADMPDWPRYAEVPEPRVATLKFVGVSYSVRLFLGRRDVAPLPVWRAAGEGTELDFIRSQLIQFTPSLRDGDALLEGQLAIMKEEDYERGGVPCSLLVHWFAHVAKSLRTALNPPRLHVLSRSGQERPVRSRLPLIVSAGAAWHKRQGGCLKQVSQGSVEFDIHEKDK